MCFGFISSKSEEDKPKHDAFVGINKSIMMNPTHFLNNLPFYLEAVGLYKSPTEEVVEGIRLILAELVKGGQEVRTQLELAYKGLSNNAIEGLKINYDFPPN